MRVRLSTAVCAAAVGLFLALSVGPAHAQVAGIQETTAGQRITAYEDYQFTLEGQDYSLHAGETFEQNGERYTITDASGQVIQEGYTDGRSTGQEQTSPAQAGYWFNAYEDGYDERVGGGFLLLKAGYKYFVDPYASQEQVEVRQISTDELVGYALLTMVADENGAFAGFETPIAFVDTNGDGLVSVSELDASLVRLEEDASALSPSATTQVLSEIESAKVLVQSGSIAQAYQKVKEAQVGLDEASQEQLTQEPAAQKSVPYAARIGAGVTIALGVVVALVLLGRRKASANRQRPESSAADQDAGSGERGQQ